jgi:hypothetical protein
VVAGRAGRLQLADAGLELALARVGAGQLQEQVLRDEAVLDAAQIVLRLQRLGAGVAGQRDQRGLIDPIGDHRRDVIARALGGAAERPQGQRQRKQNGATRD